MNENTKETLMQLEPFAETHKIQIDNLANRLIKETDTKLPQQFEDKLKTIPNNPLENLQIDKIRKECLDSKKEDNERYLDMLEAVYSIDEIEEMNKKDDNIINTLIKFGKRLESHIYEFTYFDEKGNVVYKEISSQDELEPLAYIQKRKIKKLVKLYQKAYTDLIVAERVFRDKNNKKKDIKELNRKTEEFESKDEKFKKEILEFANIDISTATEWEKSLLTNKIIANANGEYTPKLGKR